MLYDINKDKYLDVLLSKQNGSGVNRGFREVNNTMYAYNQVKSVFIFYPHTLKLPSIHASSKILGIVVLRIPACHAEVRDSIPRPGMVGRFFIPFDFCDRLVTFL